MNSTPIANLDTEVPVTRTVSAIQQLVERFRAKEFRMLYAEGKPSAIRFTIVDPHLTRDQGAEAVFTVELTAPSDAIRKALWDRARRPDSTRIAAQAERVAWRQLHDVIRASLIGVQSGLFTIGEVFMSSLVVTRGDGTEVRLGEAMIESRLLTPTNGSLMIGSGS